VSGVGYLVGDQYLNKNKRLYVGFYHGKVTCAFYSCIAGCLNILHTFFFLNCRPLKIVTALHRYQFCLMYIGSYVATVGLYLLHIYFNNGDCSLINTTFVTVLFLLVIEKQGGRHRSQKNRIIAINLAIKGIET